jgi:NAD(P)-dependent dehydrogenase (short-subunit alcohol dehydrogenase family)
MVQGEVAMGRLDGKIALISGGARGQGAAEARLFVREGAKVVLGDILDEAGKQVEEELLRQGGEATYVHLNVINEADWIEAVGTAVNRYGKLDILVNNAGISGASASGEQMRLEDAPAEAWDRVMDINAKGVFLGTKHAIPALRRAGGGSIINISSIAGLVGGFGPSSGAYGASKGAVRILTKSTALQYAREGIRCNSVHPGFIDTAMTERSLSVPDIREDRLRRTPLGRIGTTDDVAYGVLYLASDESAFVTGSELVIDGGVTAQ